MFVRRWLKVRKGQSRTSWLDPCLPSRETVQRNLRLTPLWLPFSNQLQTHLSAAADWPSPTHTKSPSGGQRCWVSLISRAGKICCLVQPLLNRIGAPLFQTLSSLSAQFHCDNRQLACCVFARRGTTQLNILSHLILLSAAKVAFGSGSNQTTVKCTLGWVLKQAAMWLFCRRDRHLTGLSIYFSALAVVNCRSQLANGGVWLHGFPCPQKITQSHFEAL